MLGFSVDPEADLSAPSTLLDRCVEARPILNPLIDELASRAGLTPSSARSFKGSVKALEPVALERFFRALPGRSMIGARAFDASESLLEVKRPSAAKELRALFSSRPELSSLAELDFSARARQAPGVFILIRLRPNLQVDFITEGWASGLGPDLDLFAKRSGQPLKLNASSALLLAKEATECGLTLVDFGRPARFRELESHLESSLLVSSTPGFPMLSEVYAGDATGVGSLETSPIGAMSVLGRHHHNMPVAVEPMVIEMADMALAAPAARPGLKAYQDHFVSLYTSSLQGAICAFDPGMGKTVAAAAVLQECAKPGYLALITTPSAICEQWAKELGHWAPSLKVKVIRNLADLEAFRLQSSLEPSSLIVSHNFLTLHADAFSNFHYDDMIIDELRLVGATSNRAKTFMQLRKSASRAMALTGTPDERDASEIANLAALIRNDPSLNTDVKKGSYDPSRLGPIFFRRTAKELSSELPRVHLRPSTLIPSDPERELQAAILAEVNLRRNLLLEARAGKNELPVNTLRISLQSSINLLRAATSDPTNLFRSSAPFAKELVEMGLVAPAAAHSSRRNFVANLVQELSVSGQVLVCSDFVGSSDALVEQAASLGLRAAALTGEVSSFERTMLCASFEAGDLDILAVSSSAQRGVNLQSASALVHLDLPLTAAMTVQRTGRVVRLGSTRTDVTVHLPLYEKSVDQVLNTFLMPALRTLDPSQDSSSSLSALTDEASILKFVDLLNAEASS